MKGIKTFVIGFRRAVQPGGGRRDGEGERRHRLP